MRWLALLPAAVLVFAAAAAPADEIPKRKPGLWELHWFSNDVKPSQAVLPDSAKMCIDAGWLKCQANKRRARTTDGE
jgi:hypothetical protein